MRIALKMLQQAVFPVTESVQRKLIETSVVSVVSFVSFVI